jgi:polar amino acid transport system substrate-binding protein
MKKIISMILVLLMMFSISSFAMADADYSSMSLDELKAELKTVTDGKLTVATSPDFAPYEFYAIVNGEPELAGFDMALAKYIADYIGLELEVIPMDFDGVLNELASGGVDLGLAGLSPDPKRMEAMNFSDVYYQGGQSFVTVKANADKFKSLEDTNDAKLSIGAQNGSIQMDLANQYSPDADIIALVKVTDIVAELLGGKLDGAYIETAVAENYASNYPDLAVVLEVPYESEGSAVGVVKGNAGLLEAVNMAVAAALEDGSMDSFVAEANEQSVGAKYEGLLDAEDAEAAIAEAVAEAEAA